MNKILVLLLTTLFLFSQIGLTVIQHVCGKELVKTSIASIPNEDNCCGQDEPLSNCCHNETLLLKNQSEFLSQQVGKLLCFPKIFTIENPITSLCFTIFPLPKIVILAKPPFLVWQNEPSRLACFRC